MGYGYSYGCCCRQISVISYDASGNVRWTADSKRRVNQLCLDPDGYLWSVGPFAPDGMNIRKYDPDTGEILLSLAIGDPAGVDAEFRAIGVDANGVYAGIGPQFGLYDSTTGAEIWTRDIYRPLCVTPDNDGNVYVGGRGTGDEADIYAWKLSAADGSDVWAASYWDHAIFGTPVDWITQANMIVLGPPDISFRPTILIASGIGASDGTGTIKSDNVGLWQHLASDGSPIRGIAAVDTSYGVSVITGCCMDDAHNVIGTTRRFPTTNSTPLNRSPAVTSWAADRLHSMEVVWTTGENEPPPDGPANACATDGVNSFAVGSPDVGYVGGGSIISFDGAGAKRWSRYYNPNGTFVAPGELKTVVADRDGNSYAGGQRISRSTGAVID